MIIFLDCEASSLLPGTFPVEVGWVDENGTGESYLVKPTPEWLASGTGWSAESAAVHGLSLATLLAEGTAPEQVATRVAQVLAAPGVTVYSDAPGWDGQWLQILLDAASRPERIVVQDVGEAYAAACKPLLDAVPQHEGSARDRLLDHVRALARVTIERAHEVEAERSRVKHRALSDADSVWRVWRAISTEVRGVLVERVRTTPLFRGTYRGAMHMVGHADRDEVSPLKGTLADIQARDTLTKWSLIAIRWPSPRAPDVHALGWRVDEGDVWITSLVRTFDRGAFLIRTRSGAVYRLGAPDGQDITPSLLEHLSYALRVWGYTDVTA